MTSRVMMRESRANAGSAEGSKFKVTEVLVDAV